MSKPFDADAVIRYAEQLGLQLDPWQADVIRARGAGQLVSRPRRWGMATIRTLLDDYASSEVAKQEAIDSE